MAHFDKRKAMRLSYTPISFHFRTFRFYFNCRLRACSFTWEHVPGTVSAGITGLFIVAMISRIISYPQSTANERGLKLHLSWERERLQQSSEQSDEDRSIKSKYPFMTQQSRSSSRDLRRWKGSAKIRRRRWIDLLGRTRRLKLPFLPRRPRSPANFLSSFALFLCSCVRMGRTRPAWQWADG